MSTKYYDIGGYCEDCLYWIDPEDPDGGIYSCPICCNRYKSRFSNDYYEEGDGEKCEDFFKGNDAERKELVETELLGEEWFRDLIHLPKWDEICDKCCEGKDDDYIPNCYACYRRNEKKGAM